MYSKAVSLKPLSPEWWEASGKKKITLRWRTCLPFTGMRVISVEDHRFYEYGGFDFSDGTCFWNDIKTLSLAEGGSTITQQLAKFDILHRKEVYPQDRRGLFWLWNLKTSIARKRFWSSTLTVFIWKRLLYRKGKRACLISARSRR